MLNMQNRSDKQLIADYLKGNEASLEALIQQYLKPVYSFVCRYIGNAHEAEDITQEVFVRMWRNIKKFDQRKNFKTWIFSIAKNAAIDFLRKKKTIPFSEFETAEGKNILTGTLVDSSPLPSELSQRQDIKEALNSALEKLALPQRMILYLRYNDHFTFREIAETLAEPLNTVKSRHRRAIGMLKKLLS